MKSASRPSPSSPLPPAEELREIIAGFRYHLEEEKSLGFEGWPSESPLTDSPPSPGPKVTSSVKTLEDVRAWLGDCRRCKLHCHRRTIVFGTGNPRAKLVFVGEGPGRDEDRMGEPFVGQAGQLLTRIIQAIQLTREEVYITNIIKCRPPENRNPQSDEISACEPFLREQLRIIQPKLICALGTFAAQTLLQTDEKITSLRGRFHQYQGILLMPTYHPAFLLRNPNYKRDVWEDMKKIRKEYDSFGSSP
jgi:uracil-DNA glycosylase family 4